MRPSLAAQIITRRHPCPRRHCSLPHRRHVISSRRPQHTRRHCHRMAHQIKSTRVSWCAQRCDANRPCKRWTRYAVLKWHFLYWLARCVYSLSDLKRVYLKRKIFSSFQPSTALFRLAICCLTSSFHRVFAFFDHSTQSSLYLPLSCIAAAPLFRARSHRRGRQSRAPPHRRTRSNLTTARGRTQSHTRQSVCKRRVLCTGDSDDGASADGP